MIDIRRASFGELFGVAFAVGLAFDVALIVMGLFSAILAPGIFHSGPAGAQVAASSPVQAIGVLVLLGVFAIIGNLVVSSGGAGLLIVARTVGAFGQSKATAQASL